MDSIFDKRISIYRNRLDTAGSVVTLKQFLFSTKHKSEILALRKVEDEEEQKRLKKTLPSATISGLFSYRDSQHLIEHSGFMCVDVDGQDNQCQTEYKSGDVGIGGNGNHPFRNFCGGIF